MQAVMDFLLSYGVYLVWTVVIVVGTFLALPKWKRIIAILTSYKKRKYELCQHLALEEVTKCTFQKTRIALLSYVLSCSLALKDIATFEANISKIISTRPWHLGIKLYWQTLFLLDQKNIEEAKNKYRQLCLLDDRHALAFSKSISDIFAHYDGIRLFSKNEIKKRMSKVIHPAIYRIYSEIDKQIQ
ncbi:MAG: hypothetical protein WC479_00325 [Candidatus Izemoplasmatales bacterium]|jgi:hypothetical protein